jgi:hypothetical protein
MCTRGRRVWQLPSERHSTELAAMRCETREVAPHKKRENDPYPRAPQAVRGGQWLWIAHMYSLSAQPAPRFSYQLVYAKSSTSRWIASRSRKLSVRWCAEGCCASAPSGCGCVRRRHSAQSVLPGAFTAALVQPGCWQRLPPPCAVQRSVLGEG